MEEAIWASFTWACDMAMVAILGVLGKVKLATSNSSNSEYSHSKSLHLLGQEYTGMGHKLLQ